MAAYDDVPVAAEAANVHLDAAPGGEATVVDAELAMNTDGPTGVGLQERKERLAEAAVMAGIVAASSGLAGAAIEVSDVVGGDRDAAAAAGMGWSMYLVHGASVGSGRRGG